MKSLPCLKLVFPCLPHAGGSECAHFSCNTNLTKQQNSLTSQFTKMANQNKSADFWIKNLNLVEHPEHKDGFFAVPFEDTFKVLNKNKVNQQFIFSFEME